MPRRIPDCKRRQRDGLRARMSQPDSPSILSQPAEPLQGLYARARAAMASGASVEQALLALAELNWREAAAWLLTDEACARNGCPPEALRRVVQAVTTLGLANGSSGDPELLASLGLRYQNLVSGDTAAAVIQVLPITQRDEYLSQLVPAVLRREPGHADLLRLASQTAARRGDVRKAHELLTRLGRADPSLATMQYVGRARAALPAGEEPAVRAALVSSFTVDPLATYLDLECRELGLRPDLYIAPLSSWTRDVL